MPIANATLTGSAATVLTSSSAAGTSVFAVNCKNHDTSARVITLHACPVDEAAADENMIFEVSVPAGDTYVYESKILLSNTDTLKMFADTTSVTTTTISYLDLPA